MFPAVTLIDPGVAPWHYPKELVLPTLTLVIAVTPYIARIMRASMVEILESDYVEMARLKGLSERLVLWRHAVPNGIAPTFQVIAINLAFLAGGIVVVEFVFNYPGVGWMFLQSVENQDYALMQALFLMITVTVLLAILAADVATAILDPRTRERA